MVKSPSAMWDTQVQSLGWEDPLEKYMATQCSILAWRIPWTEEPGRLQSMGSQRVGHNWATFTYFTMIFCISLLSVVISPFSFLILLIWLFSLCFLMSLASGLSTLFILSKNQHLALLSFAMVSFVSFALFSALIFKIYFLLLNLGFFISSFSSCFRCRVRLFIWLFFLFLEVCLYCYELSP